MSVPNQHVAIWPVQLHWTEPHRVHMPFSNQVLFIHMRPITLTAAEHPPEGTAKAPLGSWAMSTVQRLWGLRKPAS